MKAPVRLTDASRPYRFLLTRPMAPSRRFRAADQSWSVQDCPS